MIRFGLFLICCLPGLALARPEEKAEAYLTKDGKLKERIEVRELQGGFAGFTGTYYAIEPDGSWSTGPVLPRGKKGKGKGEGKLTAKQLGDLAKEFAKHDLGTLPNHGKPVTNPKVMEIELGKKTVRLQPERGKDNDADKAIRARYAGVADAVKGLCK